MRMNTLIRRPNDRFMVAYVTFALFFIVVAFRIFVSKNMVVTLLPAVILLLGTVLFSLQKKTKLYVGSIVNKGDFLLYACFVLLLIIATFRSNLPTATVVGNTNDAAVLLLLNLYGYVCFSYLFRRYEDISVARFVLLGPVVIFVIAVVFYILNYDRLPSVEGNFRTKPLFLTLLGFNIENKVLQFKSDSDRIHPNTLGIIAGALLSAYLVSINTLKLYRVPWTVLATMLSLGAMILIADSRVTVLNTVISVGVVYALIRYRKLQTLPYLAVVFPFFPFISLFLLEFIASTDLARFFSKTEAGTDIASGSERATIWYYCWQELSDFKLIHLIGFGDYGHYGAGVSQQYAFVFGPDGSDAMVTHNAFYQAFFDVGYLGVAVYLAVLYKVAHSAVFLYYQGVAAARLYLGFITYYILSGSFESTFNNYNKLYNLIFLLLCVAVFTHKNQLLKQAKDAAVVRRDTKCLSPTRKKLTA